MKTQSILIEDAPYYAVGERLGKTNGVAIYRHDVTAAVRVASIGFTGNEGLRRARAEIERRKAADAS